MLCIRIVHMVLVVYHRMESMIDVRTIRKIVLGMLHEVRIAFGVNLPGENAVDDRTEHMTALLAQHLAAVDVRHIGIDEAARRLDHQIIGERAQVAT